MRSTRSALALVLLILATPAAADDVLRIVEVRLDRPTVISLGVQVLITDDDDFDATATVRYRAAGTTEWRTGPDLFRVRPASVDGRTVPAQLAGSIVELAPATTYEIEIHAVDPDGTDATEMVMATTRPVPGDPATPRVVAVTDAAGLRTALGAASAGDVIELADGTYSGTFTIDRSGTADNPIVIRGASAEGTILDGGGAGGNVIEVYASHVHIERMTIRNANRAIRFQSADSEGNVVRYVRIRDVQLGIGSRSPQYDFYLCDNDLVGPLSWPDVWRDDSGARANLDGIHVDGDGHVVCHNRLAGWGDDIKNGTEGWRANDYYGNEILSAYDNGIELDGSEGNARAFRNRLSNQYSPLSFQPIYGGPAYAFRNVVHNVADEQMKLHGLGSAGGLLEPSGILVYHNTFVSPVHALQLSTSAVTRHFVILNNLFVGPASPDWGRTMNWDAPLEDARIDFNGWFPEGEFFFQSEGRHASFSAMVAATGFETNGAIVSVPIFESGLVAPGSYTEMVSPPDATLAGGSDAVDRGTVIAGFDEAFMGTAPDFGALEVGCPTPIFGPRPEGIDETNEPIGCRPGMRMGGEDAGVGPGVDAGPPGPGVDAGASRRDAGGGGGEDEGGCGCHVPGTPRGSGAWPWLTVIAWFGFWRASRSRRR